MTTTFLKGLGSPAVRYPQQATALVAAARANGKRASEVLEGFVKANPLEAVGDINQLKSYIAALLICVGFAVTVKELTVEQFKSFAAKVATAGLGTDLAAERAKVGQAIEEIEIALGIRWSTTKRLVIGIGVLSVIGGGIYLYTRK